LRASHRDRRYSRARFLEIFKASEMQFLTRESQISAAQTIHDVSILSMYIQTQSSRLAASSKL